MANRLAPVATWNMLFDKETKKITGLVDFDFACVSHPAQEFLTSFADIGGGLGESPGGDPSGGLLREAILTGDFGSVNVPEEARSKWATASFWGSTLRDRGLWRPSNIAGIRALVRLKQLESRIARFRLIHPHFLKNKTPEQIAEDKRKAEEALRETLAALVR